MTVAVKICGLKQPEHAEAVSRQGVEYIGVVFAERLRRVSPEEAALIVSALKPPTQAVGVFVDASVEEVLRHRDIARIHIAQLHGSESPEDCRALQAEGLGVWKAIRPTSVAELEEGWARYAEVADAILVEGFSAKAAGGTGSSFPHEWLDALDRDGPSLVLAGGLDAHNVQDAIETARPDIVDVSSGVEAEPGEKSLGLIEHFVSVAKWSVNGQSRPPEAF